MNIGNALSDPTPAPQKPLTEALKKRLDLFKLHSRAETTKGIWFVMCQP